MRLLTLPCLIDHSWYRRDAAAAADNEGKLIEALNQEIEDEWSKPELGVMKFRPTGTIMIKDPTYPSSGIDGLFGKELSIALPTAPVVSELLETPRCPCTLQPQLVPQKQAGMEATGGQMAPLDLEMTSALMSGSLVVNIFACKAKRRDLR